MSKNKIKVTGIRIYEKDTLTKIDYIANINTRNRNQEINHALQQYIQTYESVHGPIPLEHGGGKWIISFSKKSVHRTQKILDKVSIEHYNISIKTNWRSIK